MKKKSNRDGTQFKFIHHTIERQTSKIYSLLYLIILQNEVF